MPECCRRSTWCFRKIQQVRQIFCRLHLTGGGEDFFDHGGDGGQGREVTGHSGFGELVNHERHERHQKESLLEGAETSGRKPERVTFFATTEDTETWAFVGRGLQTAAYKSGSLGVSPSTYFSSYLNSPVFFTVRGRAGMTRGTKVGWGYQPNFLRLKNAVFLGWWGA